MLRVAEQYATTDTGRQRRANEDSLLARSPLFVVADGMGGAQAGEVASRIAVEMFEAGPGRHRRAGGAISRARALDANARIHELSHSNAEHAGMGTTLTAVYVAPAGSRDRPCRGQPRLPPARRRALAPDRRPLARRRADAPGQDHPRGSRRPSAALGDHARARARAGGRGRHALLRARAGDVYLLCSDGLTTMLAEERLSRDPALALATARRGRGADRRRQRGRRAGQHHGRAVSPAGRRRAGRPRVEESATWTPGPRSRALAPIRRPEPMRLRGERESAAMHARSDSPPAASAGASAPRGSPARPARTLRRSEPSATAPCRAGAAAAARARPQRRRAGACDARCPRLSCWSCWV